MAFRRSSNSLIVPLFFFLFSRPGKSLKGNKIVESTESLLKVVKYVRLRSVQLLACLYVAEMLSQWLCYILTSVHNLFILGEIV